MQSLGIGSTSAVASTGVIGFSWDDPSTHPSSGRFSHTVQGFACQNGFDFLKYFEKPGDFKCARNYQGSMASVFKYERPAPPETEVLNFS